MYKTISLIVILFEFSAWTVSDSFAQQQETLHADTAMTIPGGVAKRSPNAAMWRSLVPGWGQFYNKEYVKSVLVLGGQGALIYSVDFYNRKAGRELRNSEAYNFYIDRRNLMYWLMGVTTILGMVDAFIDAHLADFDVSSELSLRTGRLQPVSGVQATSIALQIRF